jgi:trimethylamine---corrinoid protein Co-methyltransferase
MRQASPTKNLRFLGQQDVEKIHLASLQLLENPGVYCESERILDRFQNAGINVDREQRVVRLSQQWIQAALTRVPKTFTLYGRTPGRELTVEAGQTYFGMGGASEPFIWDYELGGPRQPTKEDIVQCTRVGQNLDNIDFVMSLCSAGDVPKPHVFLHEFDALLRNTDKPIVYSAPGRFYASAFVEMAAAACGGEEALKQRPCIAGLVTPTAPLRSTALDEAIFEFAAAGVPILVRPGPMMGATGPASIVGTLVQTNAEALFIIVLSQLIEPGIPIIYGPSIPAMDMSTTLCTYGSPDEAVGRAMVAEMASFYGLPSWNTAATEAKLPDAAAASEVMMGMMLNTLSGMTMTQALGTLASGFYGAPEMAVIADEMARMVKYVIRERAVTDDLLAVDVIREVAHHGDFLSHDHTARTFRQELYFPQLFRRESIQQWQAAGGRSILQVAHDRVESILDKAEPAPLPPGADSELQRILDRAIVELDKGEDRQRKEACGYE